MSEESELRECVEAFESEEGDVDPFLEEEEEEEDQGEEEEAESSRELLERLRELEAENSTLALANESQREAYERCLDEVANHVVQALLNQKDLREECIKLKMRVFDLERQNRTLTELFTHTHPKQLPLVTFPEHNTEPSVIGTEKLTVSHSQGEVKGNDDRTQNGTAGPAQAPATSMEALSPFFKKKAHILEVLRKLEESDPLKFHPSACLSYHDMGQPLFPGAMGSMVTPTPCQPHRHRHSSSDSDIHEYANGEGALQEERSPSRHGGCPSCRILAQKSSLDCLLKGHGASAQPGREESVNGQIWPEDHGASAQITEPQVTVPPVDSTNQSYIHSTTLDHCGPPLEHRGAKTAHPSELEIITSGSYLSPLAEASDTNIEAGGEPRNLQPHKERGPNKRSPVIKPALRVVDDAPLGGDTKHMDVVPPQSLDPGSRTEEQCCYLEVATDAVAEVKNEHESTEQVCNGVYFSSNETSISKKVAVESYSPAPVPERTSSASLQQQQSAGKSKFTLSPTSPSSSLSEAKPSPISSPSRLLKFLKIPSIGERTQTAQALRLSPQLTRSSKIPCRNNNYEVYHSPVLSRKATTTERDKSFSSSKTDTYPGTHSAPTSPPKPEDNACPSLPTKQAGYSSHSAPKPTCSSKGAAHSSQPQKLSQKVPHYENVSDLSAHCPINGLPQFLPHPQREGPIETQQASSQEEKLLSPPSNHSDSSTTTDDSPSDPSDQDTDTESPIWQKPHHHFSLPTPPSASSKAQRSSYSSMKDRHYERGPPEPIPSQNCDPAQPTQIVVKRSEHPPSLPKRTVSSKPQSESSHHPFKERLAALGKLKSTEDLQQPMDKKEAQSNVGRAVASTSGNNERSKTAERQGERNTVEHRHSKYTDSLDGKPYPKTNLGGYAKLPGPPCHEQSKSSAAHSASVSKGELETLSQRVYVAKAEGLKIKMGTSSSIEPPIVMRSYGKCPNPHSHHSKTVPSPQNSPTKVTSKSPSKVGHASSYPRGMKPVHDERALAQKHPPRTEDKSKLTAGKKKTFIHAESFPPPPPPRPPVETPASAHMMEDKKRLVATPGPQSAIEQKVMRGIEENMLKLQEQDRGQPVETKQKTSNGIASWFGLKKSKLPALNRKPEMSKLKLNMSSSSSSSPVGGKDPKVGPRKVVESLNISKLMEKAEDLRKALEEERAYVNGVGVALDRPGRGHSCEVVMDQTQGQLALMYRGVTADNFMQQLLNRVDERGTASFGMGHRRLSFDSKRSRPIFGHQKNGISHTKSREEMDKGSDLVSRDEVTSDESLAESIGSQHFTGSGTSMRTLDSGIGTFPLPDYASSAAGKSIPKTKSQGEQGFSASQGRHGVLMKVPRKARTLERELSSLEEVNPSVLYSSALEARGPSMHLSSTIHEDIDTYGAHMQTPPTKNWTFPNLKGSAGPTDVYLGVQGEVESPSQGTPSRRSLKQCAPQGPHEADPSSLPLPPQMGLSRRGKSRTPSGPEVAKDRGLELVKERPDDILSPSRPQALETPESLSDSLYDSLSSCGSQG